MKRLKECVKAGLMMNEKYCVGVNREWRVADDESVYVLRAGMRESERVRERESTFELTLQEGGVEGLGGGLDGGSALGETRDVAKGVHGEWTLRDV